MPAQNRKIIIVEQNILAPIDKVWNCWSAPGHIVKWNNASDDWHTPRAENDLCIGGKFSYRMESRDGTMGFDLSGVYDDVKEQEYIEYSLEDGRKVKIEFNDQGNHTLVKESFEAEDTNSIKLQQQGWQNILDNFKRYTESL